MSDPVLLALLPEATLAVGIAATLVLGLVRPRASSRLFDLCGFGICVLALIASATAAQVPYGATLSVDALTALARPAILIATGLILLAGGREGERGAWTALILALALGALLTAAAAHLITLLLGIELMSLAGYALVAWGRATRPAAEAGMKYILFGGLATGLTAFGMSHVYGFTGHLDFVGIANTVRDLPTAAAVAALALAGVGIAFKLALVPFHLYAPEVYQGAPAQAVAAIGTLPKLAAAAVLVRGLTLVPVAWSGIGLVLAGIAVASLLLAAVTAIVQRDAKRIVAFSAIGHAGAVLLAIACQPGAEPVAIAGFYLAAYAVATIGALLCLGVLERELNSSALDSLAGAMRRRPWLTTALCLFLASLAGVPPLAGFLAKWGVLREALRVGLGEAGRGHLAFAALALLASTAIAAWSYLLIVRAAVLQPSEAPRSTQRLAPGLVAVLLVCAALTVGLGVWPDAFAAITRLLVG